MRLRVSCCRVLDTFDAVEAQIVEGGFLWAVVGRAKEYMGYVGVQPQAWPWMV